MQATALDRIQATAQAITLPKTLDAAQVTSWWVRPGQMVNAGDTLATVGAGNMRRGIVSPIAGKVRALTVREGATVQAGATLAYVEPEGPQKPITAPTPRKHPIPPIGPNRPHTAPQSAAVEVSTACCSASKIAHVATLATLKKEPPRAVAAAVSENHFSHLSPGKPKPAMRERTKHRGFYILPSQERAIKRLVADLALDEEKPLVCNDSLLVRAAIDVLLSLPPAALRATVATYKEREAAAQVGSGWPRPGKR
jgi:pyruvate/2-oxoglutarate dehydrogenase complex dihydrolipoamide acyltransferase (E2) component